MASARLKAPIRVIFFCHRISHNALGLAAGFYKQARDIFHWVYTTLGLNTSQSQRRKRDLPECGCVKKIRCIPWS